MRLKLPSTYRQSIKAEFTLPAVAVERPMAVRVVIRKYVSSTAGHVDVFTLQEDFGNERDIHKDTFWKTMEYAK
jgi:hypothetical protein